MPCLKTERERKRDRERERERDEKGINKNKPMNAVSIYCERKIIKEVYELMHFLQKMPLPAVSTSIVNKKNNKEVLNAFPHAMLTIY